MDRARKLSFIIDLKKALDDHLEDEPNDKIKRKLENDFSKLYESELNQPYNRNNKIEEKKELIHSPKKVTEFLKNFTENRIIKYTVHIWDGVDDKGFTNYSDFISKVNEERKELAGLTKFKPNLFFKIIEPFIFQKKLNKKQNNEDDFGWGRYSLRIGWQYPPGILRNHSDGKKPYDIEVPPNLRPKDLINGKSLIYFQDFIDLYKNEIEFRRSDLYLMIRRLTSAMSADFKINIKGIKGLSFYTYTKEIENALIRIFKNMDTAFPRIEVHGKLESDKLIIEILQENSYSDKPLDDDKLNLKGEKGEFKIIKRNLFSLCDWSIQSRFRNGKFYEIKYLFEGALESSPPQLTEINEDPKGFKYKLTFYL